MNDVDLTTFAGVVFGLSYLVATPLIAFWLFGRTMRLSLWNVILGATVFVIVFEIGPGATLLEAALRAGLGMGFIAVASFSTRIVLSVALRWLALRFLAARSSGLAAGVAFGIGYGGCEIVERILLPQFAAFSLALRASAGDVLVSRADGEILDRMLDRVWVDSVGKATVAIIFLLVEIAVSTLVWTGVRDRNVRPVLAAAALLAAYLLPMYVTSTWRSPFDWQSIYSDVIGLLIVGWIAWGRSLPASWRTLPASASSPGLLHVWAQQAPSRERPE